MICEETKSFVTGHTFNKWKDEHLYQMFCESCEVMASIVRRVEAVRQLANQCDPDFALSAEGVFYVTGHFMMCGVGVALAGRCQQNIAPETKTSLQAVHSCVGPYSLLCVCVCTVCLMLMVGQRKEI